MLLYIVSIGEESITKSTTCFSKASNKSLVDKSIILIDISGLSYLNLANLFTK